MIISKLTSRLAALAAVGTLAAAMGGSWQAASAAPVQVPVTQPAATDSDHPIKKSMHRELTGKLNLNTATEDQLMLLPAVGPAKAERIVAWRKKNGGFKRTADLRHVKGFGYKSFKRLEPYLDIKGDTTLK
ncbi:MAG TPA: helix-hairpin-helix domain-containing protein [Kofleriaceae bacterium]|nr:helix-hairpin-helix domain-containing protein [Kofleriaceae bacterium]